MLNSNKTSSGIGIRHMKNLLCAIRSGVIVKRKQMSFDENEEGRKFELEVDVKVEDENFSSNKGRDRRLSLDERLSYKRRSF